MGERPSPGLNRWHELTVPPEDLAELAAWLTELCEIRSGRARPGPVPQRRVTVKLAAYRDLAERGARQVATARVATFAAPSPALPPVVALAQIPASSAAEEITTSEAAGITGRSAERMRQLAASGRIQGRKNGRGDWRIDRADLIAKIGRNTDGTQSGNDGHGARAA